MNAPLTHKQLKNAAGLSAMELLIIVSMIFVVAGFAFFKLVRGSGPEARAGVSLELAKHLERARRDSMQRNAREVSQMAQVKIFNRRLYSIAIDGDGDGNVDIPLVKSLPEKSGLSIEGPFPKNYIFDWQGQTVDSHNNRVAPQPLTVADPSGLSAITLAEDGKVIVVPAAKITASK